MVQIHRSISPFDPLRALPLDISPLRRGTDLRIKERSNSTLGIRGGLGRGAANEHEPIFFHILWRSTG